MPKAADPLAQWLILTWERPERSYNPELREFLADTLGYPRKNVVTEDRGATGYPDIKLVSDDGTAWVVGDLKKDDAQLTDQAQRIALWQDKRKYVDGLTRYALFLTAHFLWIVTPEGKDVPGFETPLDLRSVPFDELLARTNFLRFENSSHASRWQEFVEGKLPYVYLKLDREETLRQLRGDLRAGFQELTEAATRSLAALETVYEEYKEHRDEIERNLVGHHDTQRRARVRLQLQHEFVRRLFEESLPQFDEQYGRDIEASRPQEQAKRLREAFLADSAAALIARVLFLRLVEDLGMQSRRLSDGGPMKWAALVDNLTGDARAFVRLVAEDMERVYREPFAPTVFDWIQRANGELDKSLQRLILRLNAYDFTGLSEEILGDIYQQFLPLQKRKRLGEFYTPLSVVEWILDRTIREKGLGTLLDPSCGSGSFLVRHVHSRLEDAKRRGLDVRQVSAELQSEVWGFDINPFASFISLFQILWAILRFDPDAPPPRVEVHNLNSLLNDNDIAKFIGEERLPPGAKARDRNKWRYIVGNPPYIRAERVKYGGEMRELWSQVWGQNADTGLVVLYRSLTEWLEPNGMLGMVVSAGYANSVTAGKVWQLLHPTKTAVLRKIVWMEFVEADGRIDRVWDAAVIPMILIIEKVTAREDDEIEIYLPTRWPSDEPPIKVGYKDFFDRRINPRVTNETSDWGDYLLPLLEQGDITLLEKMSPNGTGSAFEPLGNIVKWTYGIQRGGVALTDLPTGTKPLQVVAGQNLAVGWHGEAIGWIDLDAVAKRPFGKLSLWRQERTANVATIQIATIAQAPFASVATTHAAINSVIVGEGASTPQAKAIAAYINSSLARYYWALRLRTAVLRGFRSTMYPRTFEALPWPKELTPEQEQELADGYDRLAELAARAKNNPNEWLLTETERRLALGRIRITEPSLGLRFEDSAAEVSLAELQWEGERITPLAEFANAALAEYVYLLLTLTADEEAPVKASDVQKLIVPTDYAALLAEYQTRRTDFEQVERDFRNALTTLDAAVYAAFNLADDEQTLITARLARFPLDRLQPRYPWQTVRPRPIKAYMEDRFS